MNKKTDQEIVRGILQSNENAFRELIEKYESFVVNTCYKVLRSKEDAEDVAQEVFLKVFQCICELRQTENLSFWLYRISLNKSINYRQKTGANRKSMPIDSLDSDSKKYIEKSLEDPHFHLEQKEKRQILEQAIRQLPVRQQEAFFLSKYENKSYKEISELLDVSFSAVESLLFRANTNLRKLLLKYFENNVII